MTAAAISVLAGPALARAPDPAEAHFDEGLAHYEARRFREAASAFFQAYEVAPHGDALFNAGLAWQAAGEISLAATAYERALELGVRAEALDDARSRLEALRKTLGRIEVSAPSGATIHFPPFAITEPAATLYLAPGDRRIRTTLSSGRSVELEVQAVAGVTAQLSVPDEPPPPAAKAPGALEPAGGEPFPWQTVGWVSVGVSGVAAGAAIVLGLQAVSARDEFNDSGQTDAAEHDRAISLMHWTNVAWATAAITGAAGAGILLFAPKNEPTRVGLSVGVDRVVVRGRF
jgi:hypothetical protein